jgi:hypothetical protein
MFEEEVKRNGRRQKKQYHKRQKEKQETGDGIQEVGDKKGGTKGGKREKEARQRGAYFHQP